MSEVSAPVWRWLLRAGMWTPVEAGELAHDPSIGVWRFRYSQDFLDLVEEAWELDPFWISTKSRSPYSGAFRVAPGPFADLAVTGWSYEVLKKHHRGSDAWGWWERIVHAPLDNFGALAVGALEDRIELADKTLEDIGGLTREDLARYQTDSSGGFMGGERPKICVTGPDHRAIVKFPGKGDSDDLAIAEATVLTLAQGLGLNVPKHRVLRYSAATMPALYIHRFDRPGGSAFLHCVSAATALGIEPNTVREDPRRSYLAFRSKLRHPEDGSELFTRIVLNAAVGNGDDHPWNHSLMQTGRGEWRLSPLYDVTPFRHFQPGNLAAFAMAIGPRGERVATMPNLIALGRRLAGLEKDSARAEIDRVFGYVKTNWREKFTYHANSVSETPLLDAWRVPFEESMAATLAS